MAIATGTALAIAGAAAAAGGVASSVMSANAAKKAAKTQAQSAREAIGVEQQQYTQLREDLAPYRAVGQQAIQRLGAETTPGAAFDTPFTMANFQQDPGYAFRVSEGQKALERSAGARGALFSGATMKDLSRFNQQQASEEYQRAFDRFQTERTGRFNRLAAVAGIGQTATTTMGSLGAQTAANIGQNLTGIGNVQAAGQVGGANAIGQGIAGVGGAANQAMQNYLLMQALRQPQQFPTYTPSGQREILMP